MRRLIVVILMLVWAGCQKPPQPGPESKPDAEELAKAVLAGETEARFYFLCPHCRSARRLYTLTADGLRETGPASLESLPRKVQQIARQNEQKEEFLLLVIYRTGQDFSKPDFAGWRDGGLTLAREGGLMSEFELKVLFQNQLGMLDGWTSRF